MSTPLSPLKVFVSYCHEPKAHATQVQEFVKQFRQRQGIECHIDTDVTTPQGPVCGWPVWMESQIEKADWVFVVCNESYLRRFRGQELPGVGRGATWEGAIITNTLYEAQNTKFIPVVFTEKDKEFIPKPLGGYSYYHLPQDADLLYSRLMGVAELGTSINACVPRPPVTGFVTRYDRNGCDLTAVLEELLSAGHSVTLFGDGGRGKSTLAAAVARNWRVRKGAISWVSADGRASFSLGDWLDNIGGQLGKPEIGTLAVSAKEHAIQQLLAETGALLVLDNFETIPPMEQKAVIAFCKNTDTPILITGREAVTGTRGVKVEVLTDVEADDLLHRLIEQSSRASEAGWPEAVKAMAARIKEISGRNALMLCWIVGQLELAARMDDVIDDLDHGAGDAAQRIFDRSFQLLNADEQAVVMAVSLFTPSAGREALAAVAGFENAGPRLKAALKRPMALHLLGADAQNERLLLAGLTRRLARARLEKDSSVRGFKERFIAFFRGFAKSHKQTTAEDFDSLESEKENLFFSMDLALEMEDWVTLMAVRGALEEYLDLRGYWEQAIRYGEQAIQAARHIKDEETVALFSHNTGILYHKRSEYPEAKRLCMEGFNISKNLDNQSGMASSLHQLGIIAQAEGNITEAKRLYSQSLEIHKKTDNQSGIACSLHQLGIIAQAEGDLTEAKRLYSQSLEIDEKIDNQGGIAGSLHQLGRIAQDEGDFTGAKRLYSQSLEIDKKIGNQGGIACSLHQLGRIVQEEGDFTEAKRLYSQSLEIKKKLGNQIGMAISLGQLGCLAEIQGDRKTALAFYREALGIFERIKSPMADIACRNIARLESPPES